MTIEHLSWIFSLGVAAAAGCTIYLVLTTGTEIARTIRLRRKKIHLLAEKCLGVAKRKPVGARVGRVPWKEALPILGGVLLALKTSKAPLISLYFLVAGSVLTWYFLAKARNPSYGQQVDELAEKLGSIWTVKPQPFAALGEAVEGLDEPIRGFILRALDAYRIGVPSQRIWTQLREEGGDPYLTQLVDIMQWAEAAGMKEVEESLSDLVKRLVARRDLRRRAKVSLALTAGTVKFLQVANTAAVVSVALMPYLWDFYSAGLSRQFTFFLVAFIPLAGALYMQNELERMREKVL